jgi:DNA replication protein DnaC
VRDRTLDRRLRDAHIPPRYQRCTLDSFVAYQNEQLLRAVAMARRFCESFPVVEKGLMLIGPPGIGKTHIAVAVLRDVIRRTGARGMYYDTRALLRDIRSTYNPVTHTAEIDVIRPVMDAELLVLDDLGAERLTDWVEETMSSLQRAAADDLHVELRRRARRRRAQLAARSRGVSASFPTARDV